VVDDCQPREGCVECPLYSVWEEPVRPGGFEKLKRVDSPLDAIRV